jgi:type II secretory pathway pseudopilin PulG
MIEMMIVIALVLIVTGIAFMNTQGALKDSRVNAAYNNAFMQLRLARQRAIEERKRYIVTFGLPALPLASTPLGAPTAKSVQVYRWDAGNPSPAPVQVSTLDLPSDVAFQTISGLPTGSSAVPDGFGSGITAIDFDQGVPPGGGNLVMFMPDGSAHDLLGRSNNGILYLARNGDLSSSRAVTVFGTSGRIRGWRLTLPGGVATWVQQ